jgi:hypothetical protein
MLIFDDLNQEADVEILIIHRHHSDESRIVPVTAGRSQTDSTGSIDCKSADNTQKIQSSVARNSQYAGRDETVAFPLVHEDLIA